jgi:hypothetical protein
MRKTMLSLVELRSAVASLAGLVLGLAGTQSLAAPLCTPELAIAGAQLADIRAGERIWSARVAVDASQCSTTSGRFFIRFVRLKEIGPDLPFSEPFTWRPGMTLVSTRFAADEAVLDYCARLRAAMRLPRGRRPITFQFRRSALQSSAASSCLTQARNDCTCGRPLRLLGQTT